MISIHELFSHLCGLQHTWMLGDRTLPFCQRCTGLYVGSFVAFAAILAFRPRPDRFRYWLHGAFLLLMIPFGFHLLPQGPILRTSTGFLFGFGLIYYLALNPFTRLWKPAGAARTASYSLVLMASLVALLFILKSNDGSAAIALTWLGTFGLATLMLLTLANLAILPRTIRQTSPHRKRAV